MKNLLLMVFILCGVLSSAQDKSENTSSKTSSEQDTPTTMNLVKDLIVYPGCEKHEGNKRELIICFSTELQKNILRNLDMDIPEVEIPQEKFAVRLQFVVNREGEITQIEAIEGDEPFKPQAIKSLQDYADYLKRKGIKIKPAKTYTGETVSLIFSTTVQLVNMNFEEEYIIYNYQQGKDTKSIQSALREKDSRVSEKEIDNILKPYRKKKNRLF